MATTTHIQSRDARRRVAGSVLLVAALLGLITFGITGSGPRPGAVSATSERHELDGRDERQPPSLRPTVEAAFPEESYAPGNVARLVIWTTGRNVSLQLFHAGTEAIGLRARDVMLGSAVTPIQHVGNVSPGRRIAIHLGDWASGLYFAKLVANGGRIGYAPFVLRPRKLGEHRIAVALPTMTWQAYNFHDDDGNGTLDTWYAGQKHARLGRPYENRGVIPHYKYYDQPFLRWLLATGREVDYLADADVDRSSTTGRVLANDYDLIVFPGHHEYVTPHEYDAITGYRNLGGNLMFLSANNFFWRTVKSGKVMTRTNKWRDLGRPESSLIGVQYFGNDAGQHRGAWILRDTPATRWIFAGTGLGRGSRFANAGIEADETTSSSPRGTQVIGEIPNLFGTGHDAQMTYYETKNGAQVFAAGAFTIAGSVWWPDVNRVMENLWARLAGGQSHA
jgi:hypothetical protein